MSEVTAACCRNSDKGSDGCDVIKALERAICIVIRLICVWKSWHIDLRYSNLLEDLEAVPAGHVPAGHVLISADRYIIC
ncbi:hypothetical protein Tco_0903825 [Tanacetum coccineum]